MLQVYTVNRQEDCNVEIQNLESIGHTVTDVKTNVDGEYFYYTIIYETKK